MIKILKTMTIRYPWCATEIWFCAEAKSVSLGLKSLLINFQIYHGLKTLLYHFTRNTGKTIQAYPIRLL